MPIKDLPINPQLFRNIDEYENDSNYQVIGDGYINQAGSIVKRDGLDIEIEITDSLTIPSTITLDATRLDGIYWMEEVEMIVTVRYGNTFFISDNEGTLAVTNVTVDPLNTSGNITFASTTRYIDFTLDSVAYLGTYDILFMANGGRIVAAFRQELSRDVTDFFTTELWDSDAPTMVSHIDFLDGYLIANSVGTNRFYWSEVDDPFTWSSGDLNSTSGYASAEFDTDNIVALKVFKRELFLFGSRSTEVWQNDGETPFVRTNNGAFSTGCIAPYSIAITENYIYWLSDKKKLVRSNGGGIEVIPTAFDREIQEFDNVTDCTIQVMTVSGRSYLKLNFASENSTFVLTFQDENFQNAAWSRWGNWNSDTGQYDNFMGDFFAYSPTWNKHFLTGVATNDFGSVKACLLEMSRDHFDDSGYPIRFLVRTGQIDHGVLAYKRNKSLFLKLKRGTVDLATTPVLMIRWKDDNKPNWSNEKTVSLGNIGDTFSTLEIPIGGIYRTRQWEFACSDSVSFSIAKIQEDVEVLG